MIVLGVDPGKNSTGWAKLNDLDRAALESGAREHVTAVEIDLLVRNVDVVAIEDQVGGFPASIIPLAFERGRWTAIAQLHGVPVVVVNPTKWQNRFFPGAQQALRGARKRPCPSPRVPPGKRKPRPCRLPVCTVCEANRILGAEKRAGSKSWKQHYTAAAAKRFDVHLEDAAAAAWIAAFVFVLPADYPRPVPA